MARKKKALPKIQKVQVDFPGMGPLVDSVGALGETINTLTETVDSGLSENNDSLREVNATLVQQSNILERGFGQNLKMGSRLLALQEKLSEEEARRRVAEEEAAMEKVNQGSLLDVQKTLEDIKELLEKDATKKAAEAASKEGGILSSLSNILGIGAAGAAAKGVLSRIPGVNRIPGLGPAPTPTVPPTATPTGAPTATGKTPIPPTPPGAPGPTTGAPGTATPTSKPPVTPPPPMTPEQKVKYEELRKQGVPAAEAKAQATTKPGFEGYAEKEKKIMEAAGKKMPEPPTKIPTPEVPAPGAPGAAAPAEAAAKKGVLGRAASVGGKALKFIPGVGWAVAAGTALYETGEAAYNAEETLGIKDRKATTGERIAAGAGGLTSALTFGLISKESAGRFYKGFGEGITGQVPNNQPLPSVVKPSAAPAAPPPPPPPTPAAAGAKEATPMAPSGQAPAAAATRSIKPSVSISGQEDIKAMIKQHEGFRDRPYKDSLGLWTVGYGHLIGDGKSLPPEWNRQFSKPELDALFEEDYVHHRKAAERIPGFNNLNEKGQGALTDLTFNMGPSWYTKWPTLQKQLKASDTEGAADNLQSSKWYQQVKSRGPTIVSLMREGKGNGAGAATPAAAPTPTAPPATKPEIPTEGPTPVMTGSGSVLTSSSGEPVMSGGPPPSETGMPVATPQSKPTASQPPVAAQPAAAPAAAPAAQPAPATPAAQPVTKPFGGRVLEASATGIAAPVAAGAAMQAMAPAKGAAVQNMSEQVAATAPPAPIVLSSPTVDSSRGGNAKPGSNGIPDPYANRGSLVMNTTFIAAA